MNELHKRLKSFTYAWKGVCSFLSKEHNAWIHCAAIIAVTIAGIRFEITRTEWLVILLCFAMVLAAEAFGKPTAKNCLPLFTKRTSLHSLFASSVFIPLSCK